MLAANPTSTITSVDLLPIDRHKQMFVRTEH